MTTKQANMAQLAMSAQRYGISADDLALLIRCERTLHRWAELECGDSNAYQSWAIERDEETGIPYMVYHPHTGQSRREKIADREKGAQARVAKIMERYPDLVAVYQGDPRGCALTIVRKADTVGLDVHSWGSRGLAICL